MPHALADLTDLVVAARTNEPRVLEALRDRFPEGRFHLPLAALDGLKNRPEIALELGARLPMHWLRLDTGGRAVPVFTRRLLSRATAEALSWKTAGGKLRTLGLAGSAALAFFKDLLVSPDVDRVVVNPLTDAELHLARTDIGAIADGKPLRSLWFYTRHGRLKHPVEIEGSSSLLGSLLTKANRALQGLAAASGVDGEIEETVENTEVWDRLKTAGPWSGLARALHELVARERIAHLDLTVTKSGDDIAVVAVPDPGHGFVERARAIARAHLSGHTGDVRTSFRVSPEAVVLSSSEALPPLPPIPKSTRPTESFGYIPLEPELPDENE